MTFEEELIREKEYCWDYIKDLVDNPNQDLSPSLERLNNMIDVVLTDTSNQLWYKEALFYKGRICYRLGEVDDALSAFNEAVDGDTYNQPWYKKALFYKKYLCYRLGENEAVDGDTYNQPWYKEAQFYKGRICYRLGEVDDALSAFNEAVDGAEENTWYSVAQYLRGVILLKQEKHENAVEAFYGSLNRKGHLNIFQSALLGYVTALYGMEEYNKGREILEKAIDKKIFVVGTPPYDSAMQLMQKTEANCSPSLRI